MAATRADKKLAKDLVTYYVENCELVNRFQQQILSNIENSAELKPLIHSVRSRMKDPRHLYDKLIRKIEEAREKGDELDFSQENLMTKINDLSGIRILHLYTDQIENINKYLSEMFDEHYIDVIEGPTARTWDIEYKAKYEKLGFQTEDNERMYTSVHYVLLSKTKREVTCELQVRTLMEEVWGEVDHAINYPKPSKSLPCREQIRALARVTSSATRLVDSIFASTKDFEKQLQAKKRKLKT